MKRYIATLVLAGALLCPSLVSANAVVLPNRNAAGIGRMVTAGTWGNWSLVWMWMAYTLAW